MSSSKISERFIIHSYDHDPADSTVATDVAWVDLCNVKRFLVKTFFSAKTGNGVTAFTLLGNSASNGGGTDVTLKTHALGTAPDAVADQIHLELDENEINALSQFGVRYVSANITCANADDEQVVTYVREMNTTASGLTADVIA